MTAFALTVPQVLSNDHFTITNVRVRYKAWGCSLCSTEVLDVRCKSSGLRQCVDLQAQLLPHRFAMANGRIAPRRSSLTRNTIIPQLPNWSRLFLTLVFIDYWSLLCSCRCETHVAWKVSRLWKTDSPPLCRNLSAQLINNRRRHCRTLLLSRLCPWNTHNVLVVGSKLHVSLLRVRQSSAYVLNVFAVELHATHA